jgi:hypothetical protein
MEPSDGCLPIPDLRLCEVDPSAHSPLTSEHGCLDDVDEVEDAVEDERMTEDDDDQEEEEEREEEREEEEEEEEEREEEEEEGDAADVEIHCCV